MSLVDDIVGNRVPAVSSSGLLMRKLHVFYVASSVIFDYKMCQWQCNRLPLSDEAARDDVWNRTHDRNANFLCSNFLSLEGLWVKLGQYLSSRADVMPPAYLTALSKCQVL